jgi:integrating conjugative element membrane protein (TIGR03747 family)
MAGRAPVVQREAPKPGSVGRIVGGSLRVIATLLFALVLSILAEWIGMTIVWPEQGARHSKRMLAAELAFLHDDFARRAAHVMPVELARGAIAEVARLADVIGLRRPMASAESTLAGLEFRVYAEAAGYVVQTFAVRVAVLALATPLFALFAAVGIAEGLMRRDLRRWGGGRESSFLYHHSKNLLGPSIVTAWMLYLAMPFSIHPNWVLLPCGALLAVGAAMTTGTFKKYL